MNRLTFLLKTELAIIKDQYSCREIAVRTGLSTVTVWRQLNDISRIDFNFVSKLEEHGLIHFERAIFNEKRMGA